MLFEILKDLDDTSMKIALMGCCSGVKKDLVPTSMTFEQACQKIITETRIVDFTDEEIVQAVVFWSGQSPHDHDSWEELLHLIWKGCEEKFLGRTHRHHLDFHYLYELGNRGGVPLLEAIVEIFPEIKRDKFVSLFGFKKKLPPLANFSPSEEVRMVLRQYPNQITKMAWLVWVQQSYLKLQSDMAEKIEVA